MRFGYTILYVADVSASLDLYERAFAQRRRFLHESGAYAELETGATVLAFASRELAASNVPGVMRPRTLGQAWRLTDFGSRGSKVDESRRQGDAERSKPAD